MRKRPGGIFIATVFIILISLFTRIPEDESMKGILYKRLTTAQSYVDIKHALNQWRREGYRVNTPAEIDQFLRKSPHLPMMTIKGTRFDTHRGFEFMIKEGLLKKEASLDVPQDNPYQQPHIVIYNLNYSDCELIANHLIREARWGEETPFYTGLSFAKGSNEQDQPFDPSLLLSFNTVKTEAGLSQAWEMIQRGCHPPSLDNSASSIRIAIWGL